MIPALRPLNAVWMGGRTTVILDEFHVLKECTEKAGRRILARPGDSDTVNRLVFESESPHSPAELVFRKPRAESSCEVRGQLFVGSSPSRLECQLNWRFDHGLTSGVEVDLSPAWLPDRVLIRALEDPVTWHPSLLPSGITRLHVALPTTTLIQHELVLEVSAISTVPGGRVPLDLPRVRPVGSRIVDEAWLAWVDKDTMIQPTVARGLAWIDPDEVSGLLTPRGPDSDLREALAWRWTADRAAGRVDRRRIRQEPSAAIRIHAQVDRTGRLLTLDGSLRVTAGARSLESIPIWVSQPEGGLESWSFRDEVGSVARSRCRRSTSPRSRLGFPKEGSARRLLAKVESQTEKTIHFHAEYPWSARGAIPLVAISRNYLFRGVIVVETSAGMRSRLKSERLRRLDPSAGEQPELELDQDGAGALRGDQSAAKRALIHAFSYDQPGGRLELITEPLVSLHTAGIIRDALLTTVVDPKGTTLNRLRLLVHSGDAHSLDLVPPPDLSMVRVRRDGLDVAPIQSRTGLSIPLPGSNLGPGSSTIVIDYVINGRPIGDGGRLLPGVPEVGMACLSFDWEVVTPSAWKAADCGSGWIASDRDNLWNWPMAALGLWTPDWDLNPRRSSGANAELLRILDHQLVDSTLPELTFAEWFSRWDSGPFPVVIDRVALSSAGLGPKSQCVPSRVKAERRNVSLATLEQHGLAIVPFSNALVITTEVDSPKFGQRDRFREAIAESLLWGSDRTDRFQTLAQLAWRALFERRFNGWRRSRRANQASTRVVDLEVCRAALAGKRCVRPSDRSEIAHRHRLDRRRIMLAELVLVSSSPGSPAVLRPDRDDGRVCGERVVSPLTVRELHRCGVYRRVRHFGGRAGSEHRASDRDWSGRLGAIRTHTGSTHCRRRSWPSPRRSPVRWTSLRSTGAPARPRHRNPRAVPLRGLVRSHATSQECCPAPFGFRSPLPVGGARDRGPLAFGASRLRLAPSRPQEHGDIVVDSEIELVASGSEPLAWRIPVSSARDIEATLDGEWLPISIEPGGVMGTLAISRAGSHLLRIHRLAAARTEAGFEMLSLPVNPMPSARVVVEPPRDGMNHGELNALGVTRLRSDGTLSGRLGPIDRIEVRWPKPNPTEVASRLGTVEGLVLWDINPAGDRVRCRLTFHQPQALSTIRFRAPARIGPSIGAGQFGG